MKFQVVDRSLREQVGSHPRGVRSEWMQALLDGKTIKLSKEDRRKIGGNIATLRKHGLKLRTGMINETEIIAWTEPLEDK